MAHKRVLRLYQNALQLVATSSSAVVEVKETEPGDTEAKDDPFSTYKYQTPRVGQQYFSTVLKSQRDANRRRLRGGGRPRKACMLRELLMEWYSDIRHSVDCKSMVRFPKKVLLVKAQMLQQDYDALCLKNKLEPETVQVSSTWLNQLLAKYRVSHRFPDRKCKVPRAVLAERLMLFWVNVAKLRKLIRHVALGL